MYMIMYLSYYKLNRTDGGDGVSGLKQTSEHKAKRSRAMQGKPKSAEHNRKNSESNKGKPNSELHKLKLSGPKEKVHCCHCNALIGGKSNFYRWHGDNCKLNILQKPYVKR